MANNGLAHFLEFQTNWSEMQKLPEDHLAAISVLDYAASETNALSKIYLCQDHDNTGESAVDSAINIHRYLILRTWSSRLFEAVEFLDKGKRKDFTSDPKLLRLSEMAMKEFSKISAGDGYETARDIRHEATNHYSFRAAKKNLAHVPASMDCSMYLAEKNGNSFFPMGEAVMFHARLNRRWSTIASKTDRELKFGNWLKWNLKANCWLSGTHADFVAKLVFEGLGRNNVRKTAYWVSKDFVGKRNERLTPIYLQDPN